MEMYFNKSLSEHKDIKFAFKLENEISYKSSVSLYHTSTYLFILPNAYMKYL